MEETKLGTWKVEIFTALLIRNTAQERLDKGYVALVQYFPLDLLILGKLYLFDIVQCTVSWRFKGKVLPVTVTTA